MSRMLAPTTKEAPKNIEGLSHQLLSRAGFIRQVGQGIFEFLPLGLRVVRNISSVVRKELEEIGCQEVSMPVLNPRSYWDESGRWESTGDEMFRLKDRDARDYALGMTHEEIVTDLVRRDVRSYKELPLCLYQVSTKFRDEAKPRGGLIRTREFITADAYSFHQDQESLNEFYQEITNTYRKIFERLEIETIAAQADPGFIGGFESTMFVAKTEAGDDTLYSCPSCNYYAMDDVAYFKEPEVRQTSPQTAENTEQPVEVHTPGVSTIEDLAKFLRISPKKCIKCIIVNAGGTMVMALVRGDRELSEFKLRKVLNVAALRMATPEDILEFTGGGHGFSGPVGLSGKTIIADTEIAGMTQVVAGANKTDYHLLNVNPGRDFQPSRYVQLRKATPADSCPVCGQKMQWRRVMELGHLFKLGTCYSEPMKATFDDEKGEEKPFVMGCYGIGVSRLAAALVELHHDKDGIMWPVSVVPFQVVVMPVQHDDPSQMKLAEEIYTRLQELGTDVVLDDRESRPGVKFKDADLIGYPVRIVTGKYAHERKVEVKFRTGSSPEVYTVEDALSVTLEAIAETCGIPYPVPEKQVIEELKV